ncbi:MAG: Putative K(+)-stimulated pyrophosphate-energized sodium pump [Candidatus Moanabacter tarae]|uniref:Putative K(+)-stimulated pyrophosphate-energized sodium pump n=1 Tax=Candidatus Moanibacter tarae TaxID=2200854 RepID=A0A2Z4ADP0_9BACT|nr:MAG: Putative K(+)-stimulated pyrophosphate-energized sodium pump [Candidatus Moanabacter tarae]|tara:strand:- start:9880 stop:12072 length:2193 start_codon:yes stop_codon:yes gene_type:complete
MEPIFWIAPVASLITLFFAWNFFRQMKAEDEGTERMKTIASHVTAGAHAYLRQQYKVVVIVFLLLLIVFVFLAFGLKVLHPLAPLAFITGGFFSGLAGFFGMKTATHAANRTARAAQNSLDHGLRVAFRSGAVMGLSVVGLGLLAICVWFAVLVRLYPIGGEGGGRNLLIVTTILLSYGMGASLQALFARVGGGIYTKAADVGADLVGKVEAGIPEDDPRNAAVIADNVGDFVGDVAGMGADLFESYCGSILATAALGAAAFINFPDAQIKAVIAPMLVAGLGALLSVLGVYFVRVKEGADQRALLHALDRGINTSAILVVIGSYLLLRLLGIENSLGLWAAIVTGLVVGIVIGKATEHYTSHSFKPTRGIAESSETGPATVIISGIGTGMISTVIPVVAVASGIILAYLFSSGFSFSNISMGLYGIGFAAVGMLSTLGITLATDAYGPIADNAGGNAEMSGLDPEVRERTDALDALGNTTAAIGKGFAIGSAALTALALLASYIEQLKAALAKEGGILKMPDGGEIPLESASFYDFISYFQITLINPVVLVGVFIGSLMAFLFCGLTMNAVGRAASSMVEEVRRQFKEIPGILEGEAEPDYARCVEISTLGAQREILMPSLVAVGTPVVTGILFGPAGVIGLLTGGLCSGFVLAVFMANSGGAWDNAKKYVEEGNLGGKGSDAHKATVIGDTVGDPFKDTSGPSLNILIKLMSMVSIALAGVTVAYSLI